MHSASMFSWDDLRFFIAFARAGSLNAAAKALHVNQSTVQRRLATLEESLGRQLVARRLGRYALTEVGNELWSSAERVDEAITAFHRNLVAADSSLSGRIRVTIPAMLADRLQNSRLVDDFSELYPDLKLELLISDRCLDLAKSEADLAIRAGDPRDENLVARKIAEVPYAVYGSRLYLERHGFPARAEDIGGHLIATCCAETSDHPVMRWLRSVAPNATISARCDTGDQLARLVGSGAGLALLLANQRDNSLIRVMDCANVKTRFYLLMHKDMRHTPRVRAFADFVASNVKDFRALLA
jgi:DNA-binding transcriptional LysR family regulator